MTLWTDQTLLGAVDGTLVGPAFDATGAALHTDLIQPGDLFFALQGEASDGHNFLEQAFDKGAAAAVVTHVPEGVAQEGRSFVVVPDTLRALLEAAVYNRERLAHATFIAVTGSVGKTTTRRMLATALEAYGAVFTGQRNYNTLEGVSIDLCRCPLDSNYVVLEVGMNHPGEIAPTALLIQPDVAVITRIAENHIEFFGDLDGIALEKSQLFLGLQPEGAGVISVDGERTGIVKEAFQGFCGDKQLVTVSTEQAADVILKADKDAFQLVTKDETVPLVLTERGGHFRYNATVVAGVLRALGLSLAPGIERLKTFKALEERGTLFKIESQAGLDPITVIDESYNAAFTSTKAALERLAEFPGPGAKIFVFGDMLELGANKEQYHTDLAPVIERCGVDQVLCCGPLSQKLYERLPESLQGAWAPDSSALCPLVEDAIKPGDVVLVKGSLGMNMRHIMTHLKKRASD